jgi:hypothetical protein
MGSEMRQVFISYRRADAGDLAESVAQSIRSVFGKAAVFIDTGDVPAGSRWAAVLDRQLEQTVSLLCVIGEHWTGDVGDGVRREVRTAIDRRIPVLPVVADPAHLPTTEEVPTELRPILDVQALRFQGSSADIQELIDWLTPHLVPLIRFVEPLTVDHGTVGLAAAAFVDRLGQPSLIVQPERLEGKRAQVESDAHACRVRQPVEWPSLIAGADRAAVPARVREDVLSLFHNVERRLTLMWVPLVRYSGHPTEGGTTMRAAINLLRFAALRVLHRLSRYGATTAEIQPPLKDALRWEERLDRFFTEPEAIAQARVTRVSGIDRPA